VLLIIADVSLPLLWRRPEWPVPLLESIGEPAEILKYRMLTDSMIADYGDAAPTSKS